MAVIAESAPQPTDLSGLCLALTELAPWPMAMVEEAGHIVRYVNPAFCRLLDKPSEQLVGISFREMLPESTECAALLDRVFRTGKPESHTEQQHSKSHPVFWSFTMWPVSAGELPVGVMIQVTETAQYHEKTVAMNEALLLGSLRQHELTEAGDKLNAQLQREITERKRTEALLSCQKQVFEMIAVGAPLMEALTFLVRATESQSPQQLLVAIHLLDESGVRFEQTVAPSLPPEYSQAVNGMAVSSATGSCCAAVAQRRRVVVSDIAGSKEWPAFASFALPLGLRAAWSTPIFSLSGKVLGTLVSYSREVCEPDPQDESLGAIVTRTAAVVIERDLAERRVQFFMKELAHRGQNQLAVIHSIVSRSLTGARPLAEARDVLMQRLQALARTQSVLIAGGVEAAPVAEIVRLELEAFSERVKAVGPEMMLNPRSAQTFALVVHELATNAAKHGALSQAKGQIDIHWSIDGAGAEARFKFRWQELDGPPVAPPTRQGFGRILLEKAAAQDFGAQPKITFAPEGLIYEIDAPLSVVAAATSQGGRNS